MKDTAQLLAFVRGLNSNFNVTEEQLSVEPLKDATADRDSCSPPNFDGKGKLSCYAIVWVHKTSSRKKRVRFISGLKI